MTAVSSTFSHFVFVDFENVPSVDLALVKGKPVQVTLLIGEKQTRVETALVLQIHQYAPQLRLIQVGDSGRNALDLVLAAHLGQAVSEYPAAAFTIVSGDKDFDPLVAHFSASGRRVAREPDFSALAVFGGRQARVPAARSRVAAKPVAGAEKVAVPTAAALDLQQKKMADLVTRLSTGTNRPRTRDRLLHYIHTGFGQKLAAEEQEKILNDLQSRGIFTIPDGKKVVYSS